MKNKIRGVQYIPLMVIPFFINPKMDIRFNWVMVTPFMLPAEFRSSMILDHWILSWVGKGRRLFLLVTSFYLVNTMPA